MNPFANDEPHRVDLGQDALGREQWIDLRRELTIAVEDAYNAKMFQAKFDRSKAIAGTLDIKDIDLDIDLGRAMSNTARLEMWIVDWQLFDRQGQHVDLSSAAIGKLSKATSQLLLNQISVLEADADRLGESLPALATST